MDSLPVLAARLGIALGIGLLIGAERERHKRMTPHEAGAGMRTIALVALLGAVAGALARGLGGGVAASVLLVGVGAAVTALIVTGYHRTTAEEPGVTTEVTVLLTLFLGVLTMYQPLAAAALSVVVAGLLVARTQLHDFVTGALTEQELQDALILLAATLVVLPILPRHAIDPLGAFVPSAVWTVAVAVMAIGAAGHIARRTLGPAYGLPAVGFASGFVSSLAAVASMGAEARTHPEHERAAVVGATLSTLSTVVQLSVIVALASIEVLRAVWPALVLAGLVAAAYAGAFTLRETLVADPRETDPPGRAFDLRLALAFAVGVSAMLMIAALARHYLGTGATLAATALVGFGDAHSASYSVSSLAAHGGITSAQAALGVLLAFSANSLTKAVVAWSSGGRRFFARVAPGLALVLVAAWLGATAAHLV